jgi:TetR/AcrR family transcriptional regulator, regulator of cefoperazone and chloramphenicol sensitivity
MKRAGHSDLTTHARIRNAALVLFGENGVRSTSIRKIAKAAGVSPGLVQHHFPTKRLLENAVAAYVAENMAQLAKAEPSPGRAPGTLTLGGAVVDFIRSHPDVVVYVRRVILDDSPMSRKLLDSLIALSRSLNQRLSQYGLLRNGLDLQWTVFNTMMLVLGPLLFERTIDRYLGVALRSNEGLARWDAAVEDLLLHGIYRRSSKRTNPSKQRHERQSSKHHDSE